MILFLSNICLGSSLLLSFSACTPEQFTCRTDGFCIDLGKRCDMRSDCYDGSDEIGCEKLLLPPEYIITLPPKGHEGEPLEVDIGITIGSITDVRTMANVGTNMKLTE